MCLNFCVNNTILNNKLSEENKNKCIANRDIFRDDFKFNKNPNRNKL